MQAASPPDIRFGAAPERVLVTGAAGFIGQHLVAMLIANGHEVLVLTRVPARCSALFGPKVRALTAMSELSVHERIDVVVNLAGARIPGWRWTDTRKRELRDSRIGLLQKAAVLLSIYHEYLIRNH